MTSPTTLQYLSIITICRDGDDHHDYDIGDYPRNGSYDDKVILFVPNMLHTRSFAHNEISFHIGCFIDLRNAVPSIERSDVVKVVW